MTKISVTPCTVPLNGVTSRSDLVLRELWLQYAAALGPFDYVFPLVAGNVDAGLHTEQFLSAHRLAHDCLTALRRFVSVTRDPSDFARCVREWLHTVNATGHIHGTRTGYARQAAKRAALPLPVIAAEVLMRARCDDAMVRLEGRSYNDLYLAVLDDFRALMTEPELSDLRACCAAARAAADRQPS